MKIKDIMTKAPFCCTPDMNLEKVAKLMCEHDCGEIPVIDGEKGNVIGVITDRDITCRAVAQGKNPFQMTAQECMTENCITATPETSLEECCELLEEHQIRRLPIIDHTGRCCGIVSQADIARHAPKEKVAEVLHEVSQPC